MPVSPQLSESELESESAVAFASFALVFTVFFASCVLSCHCFNQQKVESLSEIKCSPFPRKINVNLIWLSVYGFVFFSVFQCAFFLLDFTFGRRLSRPLTHCYSTRYTFRNHFKWVAFSLTDTYTHTHTNTEHDSCFNQHRCRQRHLHRNAVLVFWFISCFRLLL